MESEQRTYDKTEEFVRLLLNHESRIYAAILAATLNASDADDIMQETVLTMCRKFRESDEEILDFAAWGASIARFKCREHRKKNRRTPCCLSEEALDALAQRDQPLLTNLDVRMEALEICLAKLPQRDLQLLSQRYEQGARVVDIARSLGRSAEGMYKSMARIHNALRECVQRKLAGSIGS